MSNGVRSCPLCGDSGFVKVATRCNPEGEWEARMKCEECGIELIKSGETEDAAITELLKAWNTRAERTCHLERIPYEPGEYEGMRCSVCKTTDLDMGEGPYCSVCGAKVVE